MGDKLSLSTSRGDRAAFCSYTCEEKGDGSFAKNFDLAEEKFCAAALGAAAPQRRTQKCSKTGECFDYSNRIFTHVISKIGGLSDVRIFNYFSCVQVVFAGSSAGEFPLAPFLFAYSSGIMPPTKIRGGAEALCSLTVCVFNR